MKTALTIYFEFEIMTFVRWVHRPKILIKLRYDALKMKG